MRKLLILAMVSMAMISGLKAQVLGTVGLDLDSKDFEKAYTGIEEYVNGKGSTNYKAWAYRGHVYLEFALLKYDLEHYKMGDAAGRYTEEDLKKLQDKIDEPLSKAFEFYQKAVALDEKGKAYKKEVESKITTLAQLSINQAIKEQNNAATNKDDEAMVKASMQKAHDFYQLTLDALKFMPEKQRDNYYNSNLARNNFTYDYINLTMARCSYFAGNFEAAEKEYKAALKPGVLDLDVLRHLSTIYMDAKRIEDAKALWEKARKDFPENADIALEEAVFYQTIGETDVLMTKLDDVIRLDPENATLYTVQGKILSDLVVNSNNELSKELDEQDKSIILSDEQRKKYYDKALMRLKKAVELKPEGVSAYNHMGILYYSEGLNLYLQRIRLSSSKADIAKANELKGQYTEFFEKAIAEFEKTLKYEPEDLNALKTLQEIYARMKDVVNSKKYEDLYRAAKANQKK